MAYSKFGWLEVDCCENEKVKFLSTISVKCMSRKPSVAAGGDSALKKSKTVIIFSYANLRRVRCSAVFVT